MEMPTFIKKIMSDTQKRNIRKDELDEQINLSKTFKLNASEKKSGYFRLLTDGVKDYDFSESDDIRFYMKKGTCKKIYDNLENDFVGELNEGHKDFVENLVQLGIWKKSDIVYGEDEKGFGYLDFKPTLNTNLSRVQDIIIQGYPVGFSAELILFQNEKDSIEKGFEVYEDGNLTGIAVVGASGDSKAGNVFLQRMFDELEAKTINKTMLSYFEEVNDNMEKSTFTKLYEKLRTKTETPVTEDVVEETVEDEVVVEDTVVDEILEDATEEKDLMDVLEAYSEKLNELSEKYDSIKDKNLQLQEENKKLKTELGDKENQLTKVKELSKGIENLNVQVGRKEELKTKGKNERKEYDAYGSFE